MKIIFITIFHGHIARNTLHTDILKYLKDDRNLKVVILCPEFKVDYYQKQFGGNNIIFEGVSVLVPSKSDNFFRWFYHFFVDTTTVRLLQGEKYLTQHKYLKYIFKRILTIIFGNIRVLRQIIRFLDKKFVYPNGFGDLFNRYNPNLVFISSITSDQDSMVLRESVKRNVYTIGMVRSWDNFTVNKGNIRIYPNKLLVHNKYILEESVKLADVPRERIQIVGMPNFDYYVNDTHLSKQEISQKLAFNPSKRIVLFLMIGLSNIKLDEYIVSILEKWIQEDPGFNGFQLIIRPHPNTNKLIKTTKGTITNFPNTIEFKSNRLTDREFTKEDLTMYAGLIANTSVVISYQGTAIVDAAAFKKPIVTIAFDEKPDLPYLESIRHQYEYTHLQPVLKTGGVKVVYNENELKQAILDYDKYPENDREGREKIVSEQCFKFDGRSSLRVFEEIKKSL